MAQNTFINTPPNAWTQVTSGTVSSLRVQNLSAFEVFVQATSANTEPVSVDGSIMLQKGERIDSDITLATLFPGVAGANRAWVYSNNWALVSVSHA